MRTTIFVGEACPVSDTFRRELDTPELEKEKAPAPRDETTWEWDGNRWVEIRPRDRDAREK